MFTTEELESFESESILYKGKKHGYHYYELLGEKRRREAKFYVTEYEEACLIRFENINYCDATLISEDEYYDVSYIVYKLKNILKEKTQKPILLENVIENLDAYDLRMHDRSVFQVASKVKELLRESMAKSASKRHADYFQLRIIGEEGIKLAEILKKERYLKIKSKYKRVVEVQILCGDSSKYAQKKLTKKVEKHLKEEGYQVETFEKRKKRERLLEFFELL